MESLSETELRLQRKQAALELRRELLAETKDLSALVKETAYVIGQVARNGYTELNKLPAKRDPAVFVLSEARHSLLLNTLHLRPRTYVRENAMPDSHIPVPGNGEYVVAATSTMNYARYMPIRLPGRGRQVEVQLHNPGRPSYTDPLFQIGVQGSASFFNQYKDTSPSRTVGNPRSPVYHASDRRYYYASAEGMRDDYAASFSGALAVADLVATSLKAVHGIESDTTSISPLLQAWQNVAVTDRGIISPYLVEYLPRDLAEQAGA